MIHRGLVQCTHRIRIHLAAQALFSVLLTGSIIGQMYLLSVIIDGAFQQDLNLNELYGPLAFLFLLIVVRALLTAGRHRASEFGAIHIKTDLRQRLISKLTRSTTLMTRGERTGELSAVFLDGLDKIDGYLARYIPKVIQVLVVPLAIASLVSTIDRLSGAILFATAPLIPLFMWLIGSTAEKRTQRQWLAMSRMSAHFLDVLQGLTTLKLFGRQDAQKQEIRRVSNQYRLTTMGVLKIAFMSGLVLELAASLSTAIVAVQIGIRLVEGHLPFQAGLFVLLLTPEFYLPFRQLGAEHHAAMEGKTAADRLFALLNAPPMPAPRHPLPAPTHPFDITFTDVTYQYPERAQAALDRFSARFRHGEITAIVGPSGAGKSTLFSILTRELDPVSGAVHISHTDLQDIQRVTWRTQLALVPQRPALFQGTVADNLKLARPNASPDEIEQAARHAEAHDFIIRLPQGYDTPLGEQAWRLSGGERQRLAIARALLKDAPVLLMDEPSANLDPESEERLGAAFERLARNRLVLIIAHRLRTVYRAHRILVLEEGRMVESGTHGQLIKQGGFYARMIGGRPCGRG